MDSRRAVYNFLGEHEQMITSDADVPTGTCVLGVARSREGSPRDDEPRLTIAYGHAYASSRPISCSRWTASLREETPTLR